MSKHCFVPSCKNSSATSNKTFVYVPKPKEIRQRWFTAVGREYTSTSTIFCCEDHFDGQRDIANLTHYKLMKGRIILKSGVVPHLKLDDDEEEIVYKKKRFAMTKSNDIEAKQVCRTCLTPFGEMNSLYEVCSGTPKICFAEMLTSFTPLKCFRNDGLPTHICSNCMEELSRFNTFQLKCLESDRKLREDIKREQLKTDNRHIFADMLPIHPDNILTYSNHKNSSDSMNVQLPKSPIDLVDVKTELDDDSDITVNQSNPTKSAKDPLEDSEQELNFEHVKIEIDDFVCVNEKQDCVIQAKLVQKQFTCKYCNSVFKSKSFLNIHLRTHTGEKAYSCTLCDCSFVEKLALIAHSRKHVGEKPFSRKWRESNITF